jgi:hypothetical protein
MTERTTRKKSTKSATAVRLTAAGTDIPARSVTPVGPFSRTTLWARLALLTFEVRPTRVSHH